MKTFKFSLVLGTLEYTDIFITLNENIYGIHSKYIPYILPVHSTVKPRYYELAYFELPLISK